MSATSRTGETERAPMQATVAFSAWYLDQLGVPEDMTEDELSECLDKALLAEVFESLRWEIEQWAEDRDG